MVEMKDSNIFELIDSDAMIASSHFYKYLAKNLIYTETSQF